MFPNIPGYGEDAKFLGIAKDYENLKEPAVLVNLEQYGGRPNWVENPLPNVHLSWHYLFSQFNHYLSHIMHVIVYIFLL